MTKPMNLPIDAAALRILAEQLWSDKGGEANLPKGFEDARKLLQDLQIHQIELELHNKALQQNLLDAEAKLALLSTMQKSLQLTQFALDHLSIPTAMMRVDDGRFIYVNDAGCKRIGYSREELLCMSVFKVDPDFSLERWNELNQKLREGHVSPFETTHKTKDGTTFRVEVTANVLEIEDTEYHIGFAIDITERKKAQETLEAALEFSNELIRSMQDGFSVLDNNGNAIDANPALCRMTGFDREELIGLRAPFPYWPPEEYENIQNAFQKTLRGEVSNFELIFMRKNGERFPVIVSPSVVRDKRGNIISYTATVKDISEHMHAVEALRRSEAWFRSIFENTNTCIASTDSKGQVTSFNEAFRAMLGYDAESLRHMNFADFTHPDDLEVESVFFNEILERKRNSYQITKRYINREGRIVWVDLSAAVIRDQEGNVANFVAVIQDITDRKAAEVEIEHLAFYDPLTQLPNRRLLQERLGQALASHARNNKTGALLFIDLDNFKSLNDTLGHDIGDLLLQQVARRLDSCVREGDSVARLGGDEFVIMLEDLSDHALESAARAESVGEKILSALSLPYRLGSYDYQTTASIGATLFSNHNASIEDLMKQADIAMYQAKQAGRNTLRFFDHEMQKRIAARVELESELRRALEQQQFQLYYQIQVDSYNRPIGAEALIRWQHPDRGLVSPTQFIRLAEETGLILPMGQWVLEMACSQIKAWEKIPEARCLVLAVNVSAKQFRQPGFVDQVNTIVNDHGINPMLLKLELTEGMLLDNLEDTVDTMNALNDIGVQFSLDDFGTGYSSLQYIKRLPLDQLKIDKSFIHDLAADSSDRAIVHTIIAMARNLNLDAIAEGVETEEQRQLLLDMGCIHFQGFLFGMPSPVEQFEASLKGV